MTPDEVLAYYLEEVAAYDALDPIQEQNLLQSARAGDGDAAKKVVLAHLKETADISLALDLPGWMGGLDRVQEANIVTMRLVERPDVDDVGASLRAWVPYVLRLIASRGPRPAGVLPPDLIDGPFPPTKG